MKPPITNDIQEAARLIREGRVVAFPTGTSYGLAVNALQGHALQRLRNLKKRPEEKTFTVCAQSALWDKYVDMSEEERTFVSTHANQAFTVLVPAKEPLAHLAQDGRVGLRIVDNPVMEELVQAVDVPLTATSANISDQPACYTPQSIQETFPWLLDSTEESIKRAGPTTYDLSLAAILDGGVLTEGRQSTIVRHDNGEWVIVRQGSGTLA